MADETALVIRDVIAEGIAPSPDIDLTGRQVPRRHLGMMTFLRVFPACAVQFDQIPGEFWTQDLGDDGYTEAVIACPCGMQPRVEIGCMEICACERAFLYAGTAVLVANSPKAKRPQEPLWQSIARQWSANPTA